MPRNPDSWKSHLRARARDLGFDDIGFTSAAPLAHGDFLRDWLQQGRAGAMSYLSRGPRSNPRDLLEDANTLIVVAAHYSKPRAEPQTIAAYAQREDYHRVMRQGLESLGTVLEELAPGSRWQAVVDTAPLLEREAAQRAGLGWIGKSTMLVHPKLGCYTLLGELLWTAELEPDPPALDQCGTCRQCIDACPTGAIDAEYQLEPRHCLSYLTIEQRDAIPPQFREALGERAFGCDACLAACPFGAERVYEEGDLLPTAIPLRDGSLQELLQSASARFKKTFGWTPVERARKRGFLRGLLTAAGNSGDQSLIPQVKEWSQSEDSLLAEHARWALAKLDASSAPNS